MISLSTEGRAADGQDTTDGHRSSPRLPAKTRVLFDCPAALPVLFPDFPGGIGGAEVRAVQFARALAESSVECDVSMLVAGDAALRIGRPASRLSVLVESQVARSSPSGLGGMAASLRRTAGRLASSATQRCLHVPARHPLSESLNYDLLVCFGVHNRTASLVRSARYARRRVIVCLTSDRTLDDLRLRGRKQRGAYGEIGYLCRYALRHADAVVSQKRSQQLTLEREWGIPSELIRNPIDLQDNRQETLTPDSPGDEAWEAATLRQKPYVLWVGRADCFSKRADLCLQVARSCPEWNFVVVMNRTDAQTFETLTRELPRNVQLHEKVPPSRIDPLYRNAMLLLNTSNAEGFPNSFLQAGKHAVPVVSWRVDPDGMLREHGCGVCCDGQVDRLPNAIRSLMTRDRAYQQMSEKIMRYVHQYHDLRCCGNEFVQLVHRVREGALR